jgi:hypothetical protein
LDETCIIWGRRISVKTRDVTTPINGKCPELFLSGQVEKKEQGKGTYYNKPAIEDRTRDLLQL